MLSVNHTHDIVDVFMVFGGSLIIIFLILFLIVFPRSQKQNN